MTVTNSSLNSFMERKMFDKFLDIFARHYQRNRKVYNSIVFSFLLHGFVMLLLCLRVWDFSLKNETENFVNIEIGFSQEPQSKQPESIEENSPKEQPELPWSPMPSEMQKTAENPKPFSDLEKLREDLIHLQENEMPTSDSLSSEKEKSQDLDKKEQEIEKQLLQREKIRSFLLSEGMESKKIQESRGQNRKQLLREGGGGKNTENAVYAGLDWLYRHQSPNGSWDADNFMSCCKDSPCSGAGLDWADPATTGLALLAFLGSGYTNKEGKYKEAISRGLEYLISIQQENGCYGKAYPQHMYNHSIATFAICEGYMMCHDIKFRKSAIKGVLYILEGQNPGMAWRYTPLCRDNDTSVTGWCLLALKAAMSAEIQVPLKSIESSKVWLDQVTMKGEEPWVGYTSPDKNYTMTAVGTICRIFFHTSRDTPVILGSGKLLYNNPPAWSSQNDYYYWYYGTLAMYQLGKSYWNTWNQNLIKTLILHQEKTGCLKGSWGQGRFSGGRVYWTSMAILCLEVYYRYPRIFKSH